uniref:aspartate/glutamate racemase family protein n=1 Tax=Salmonella enterica TaxID=28901 RepID=UPI003FA69D5B
ALAIVERLAADGAQGVVLGCTELGLLLDPAALPLPGFDSTALHVRQALDWLLAPTAAQEATT